MTRSWKMSPTHTGGTFASDQRRWVWVGGRMRFFNNPAEMVDEETAQGVWATYTIADMNKFVAEGVLEEINPLPPSAWVEDGL